MEWEFTPQQVVKGEVDYDLDDFRHGLMQEISLNVPGIGEEQLNAVFALAYDLCYWLATGKDYDEFEEQFADINMLMFLRALREHGQGNVEMLGAILQRMIMDGVEAGLPLEEAVAQVAQAHGRVASRVVPPC
ncbi:MAG: hypothetical protein AUK53_03680 [Betaproteobacteria bacterium CG2_30_59_46]|nr:MAG: hypothetical protein AUK53_03680 [Betaproteobacteria bacterium CG2_30_59_46]PIQ09774.1 MAG: hypothetical protein COW70_14880 [Hydrogenophilales bacterium CG18_big_fil_WC_8_21_14_2_50_58_12]PIY00958.1 MAG: hypothetical protein COZ23_05540 [Hydrogenophilales bacterium CG_4_10_14_3_um_filter_58_23]PJB07547.1 MAG: hypothetical protein CO125_04475 [Hydrogenophilales bacterium CG_4_9_14_3_um_filter_59_35]